MAFVKQMRFAWVQAGVENIWQQQQQQQSRKCYYVPSQVLDPQGFRSTVWGPIILTPKLRTPLKIDGWNLQITHLERKMIFQTSMMKCSMFIFRGEVFMYELDGITEPFQGNFMGKIWWYPSDGTLKNQPHMHLIERVLGIPL